MHKFRKSPWGGGNQFLKALKKYLKNQKVYTNKLSNADIIIFNSYPFENEDYFLQIFNSISIACHISSI